MPKNPTPAYNIGGPDGRKIGKEKLMREGEVEAIKKI